MPGPDLVLFDCDGVLIDSEPLASRTLALALQGLGHAITPAEAHRLFTGNAEPDIRAILADRFGIADADSLFAGWYQDLYAAFATDLRPMAGMVELVGGLDLPKCVASNSSVARLKASLGHTALWEMFGPHVYSAGMVARPKPAPDLMLHCAAAFAARPGHCLMIDDSPHGVESALAAGMTAVGFVDPADPRLDRAGVLARAGAHVVVTGTAELAPVLARAAAEGAPALRGA